MEISRLKQKKDEKVNSLPLFVFFCTKKMFRPVQMKLRLYNEIMALQ